MILEVAGSAHDATGPSPPCNTTSPLTMVAGVDVSFECGAVETGVLRRLCSCAAVLEFAMKRDAKSGTLSWPFVPTPMVTSTFLYHARSPFSKSANRKGTTLPTSTRSELLLFSPAETPCRSPTGSSCFTKHGSAWNRMSLSPTAFFPALQRRILIFTCSALLVRALSSAANLSTVAAASSPA